ncbi:MAG: hypothetical protein M3Y27_20520 [Acidobacteriota bacterium]|nr:hypothetical protein [Acidobacteriota bacterium]
MCIVSDESRQTQPYSGLKPPDTEAAYLGMRYVVEGAQRGSRIIYRHLSAAFGDQLQTIGSFWIPGSDLQSSWSDVLKSLARVNSRESLAGAGRAARLTFHHMNLYLAENQTETT